MRQFGRYVSSPSRGSPEFWRLFVNSQESIRIALRGASLDAHRFAGPHSVACLRIRKHGLRPLRLLTTKRSLIVGEHEGCLSPGVMEEACPLHPA